VVLPEPDSPTRPSTEPRGNREIDPLDHLAQRRPAQKPGALRIGKTEAAGSEHDIVMPAPLLPTVEPMRLDHRFSIRAGGTGRSASAGRSARGVAASSARV